MYKEEEQLSTNEEEEDECLRRMSEQGEGERVTSKQIGRRGGGAGAYEKDED